MQPLLDPISSLLGLVPQPYRAILSFLLALIGVVSTVVGLTNKRDTAWAKVLRVISGVVHTNEPGTLKIPFTTIVLGVTASKDPPSPPPAARVPPMTAVLLIAALVPALSCSSPQNVNFSGWQVYVQVGLDGAAAVIPPLESTCASSTRLNADQKARAQSILQNLLTVQIPQAKRDVDSYSSLGGQAKQCIAHDSIDLAASDIGSVLSMLNAAGETIPPEVPLAVGSIAGFADALLPGCATDANGGSTTARLRARLARASGSP